MSDLTEARERLVALAEGFEARGMMTWEIGRPLAVEVAADLRTLLAALDQRDAEVERLRLAICGGEDAPGYAMSLPLETILQVQDDNRQTWKRDSELAWDGETANSWKARAQAAEQRLKAVTEALEPFIKLAAETLTPGSPDYSEWLAEAKDWTVIFSFGGHSITLGDLRRAVQAQGEAQG